ncbi:IreB family regulatory phosphoprotein [Haloimpatiens sp. FM7330]|uniref:IreB family regulatory phosphoprotein n=1 Tax=Haloimpatiens sp. FM7330 TaxID=3298610 RepID=UPI00363C3AE0
MVNEEKTIQFEFPKDNKELTKNILTEVYNALLEKGYNPVNQLVGYLMSGDPTYITNYNGARSLIRKLERDEIIEEVLKSYLDIK